MDNTINILMLQSTMKDENNLYTDHDNDNNDKDPIDQSPIRKNTLDLPLEPEY